MQSTRVMMNTVGMAVGMCLAGSTQAFAEDTRSPAQFQQMSLREVKKSAIPLDISSDEDEDEDEDEDDPLDQTELCARRPFNPNPKSSDLDVHQMAMCVKCPQGDRERCLDECGQSYCQEDCNANSSTCCKGEAANTCETFCVACRKDNNPYAGCGHPELRCGQTQVSLP